VGTTEQFCRILTDITEDVIPSVAFEAARILLLDGIAVTLGGSRETAPSIIAEHIRSFGGARQATALNFCFKTSTVAAAYVNGAAMHVLDYEPMWNPPTHALSTTLPAALALGESIAADGRQILTALIKGHRGTRPLAGRVTPIRATQSRLSSAGSRWTDRERCSRIAPAQTATPATPQRNWDCGFPRGEPYGQYRHDDQMPSLRKCRRGRT